jgi:hypothetical protein
MAFQIVKLRMSGPPLPLILHDFETSIKGKAAPLQAWSDPDFSRKIRFPDIMTAAQDGGKVVSLTHRPPLPQEIHLVLISVRG